MKVISIKEPFASLIMMGFKTIETRSWKTNYRGEIYIHASLSNSKLDESRKKMLLAILPESIEFSRGYIICKANLVDCIRMDDRYIENIKKDRINYLCGRYEVGRYAWVLDNIEIIDKIPAKGKLGIWNY